MAVSAKDACSIIQQRLKYIVTRTTLKHRKRSRKGIQLGVCDSVLPSATH